MHITCYREGGAFAAGMAEYLANRSIIDKNGHDVSGLMYLSPDEVEDFSNKVKINNSCQIHAKDDKISPYQKLKGVSYILELNGTGVMGAHGRTVTRQTISDLQKILNEFINQDGVKKTETETGTLYHY